MTESSGKSSLLSGIRNIMSTKWWESGLDEHTNGLLRQYFPKKTNFNEVSDSAVAKAINMLNDRPRKLLASRTPGYLLQQQMAALAAQTVMHFGVESAS